MTTIVTALLYSGKPNPSWELTPDQSKKFNDLMNENKEITFEQASLTTGALGYRGFVVDSHGTSLIGKALLFDGVMEMETQGSVNFIDRDSHMEQFLLETGTNSLDEKELQFINQEISKNLKGGTASKNNSLKSTFELLSIPPFNPGKWNIAGVLQNNNCYNYANDKITNTFAQPGRGSGLTASSVRCPDVTAAAQRDRLISIGTPAATPAQGHFVALVSANSPYFQDYHWYRLDSNGMWSHKPGRTPAINTDNSGRLISNPETANRGPYTDFCGYFHCIPANTTIR